MGKQYQRIKDGLYEGVFVLVLALAIFVLLALTTYHSSDPGVFSSGHSKIILNAGGATGAFIADALWRFLGYLAYVFPFGFSYAAWMILKDYRIAHLFHRDELLFRSLGLLLTMLGGTGCLNLLAQSGGWLGDRLTWVMISGFNPEGALIVLLSVFLTGLTWLTSWSWLNLIEYIGRYSIVITEWIGVMTWNGARYIKTEIREWIQNMENQDKRQDLARANKEPPKLMERGLHAGNNDAKEHKPLILPEIMTQSHASSMASASAINTNNKNGNNKTNIAHQPDARFDARFHESLLSGMEQVSNAETKNSFNISQPVIDKAQTQTQTQTQAQNPVSAPQTDTLVPQPVVLQMGLPTLSLLDKGEVNKPLGGYSHQELESLSREVEQHLLDFGIQADVVSVHPGPVITRFELQLAAGIKVSRLSALSKDLARSLSVSSVRVVEIIPGKTVVGLELPNQYRAMVRLNEVLSTDVYQQAHSPLTLALGVDIAGHPMVVDLAKMPHLLVAGTTGSGKSVGINAMILSLLFKSTPDSVRLIMVDPKMLELSVYDGIPHLLTPVVTDMKEAASALRWCVAEMERRYRLMASFGVRNIAGFNSKLQESIQNGCPLVDPDWKPTHSMDMSAPPLQSLPYIVVIIDELADMMMVVGKKVEQLIARIAQKARAAGIHLILATQRPSVDVLTGLIKSNIPTRISFQVSSKIDSRTILDQQGADQLLGHGDMLFLAPGTGAPLRVHGAFVDDQEVHRVAEDWRSRGTPAYIDEITQGDTESGEGRDEDGHTEEQDAIYDEAVNFVIQTRKASISAIQRRFKIGYNRSARLVEEMERTGILGPSDGGVRDVLVASLPED